MSRPGSIIGIIGAGKLGMVLAQLALKNGYSVYISGSGNPGKIDLTVRVISPGAIPATTAEVISHADTIVLALPLSKLRNLPLEAFGDKLVIDAMNYWWEVDGEMPELKNFPSSSEMVQSHLRGARIVKAFSHLGYHNLLDDALPAGAPDRKSIAIAGDNNEDNMVVARLVDDLGFDPFMIGALQYGKLLEPGTRMFGASLSIDEAKEIIGTSNSR